MATLRALAVVAVLLCAGCASYYQVTDPGTGKAYYTEDVKRNGSAVEFKDAATGAVVTMQNSAVKEIDKEEYKKGIATPPATEPAKN